MEIFRMVAETRLSPLQRRPQMPGPYGKCLSEVNKASIINTPVACMPPMHKWRWKTLGTYTRAGKKA
jgi:hypothetical protein